MAVVLCNVLVDELSELKKNTTVNAGQKQGIVLKSGFSKPCVNILTSNSLCYCCEVGYCIKYPAPAQQPVWYNDPTASSLPQDIYKVVVKHRKIFGTCTHVYAITGLPFTDYFTEGMSYENFSSTRVSSTFFVFQARRTVTKDFFGSFFVSLFEKVIHWT